MPLPNVRPVQSLVKAFQGIDVVISALGGWGNLLDAHLKVPCPILHLPQTPQPAPSAVGKPGFRCPHYPTSLDR